MRTEPESGGGDIPNGWDRLLDPPAEESGTNEGDVKEHAPDGRPTRGALALASWAELAVLAAPCAVALAGVRLEGYPVGLTAVPWVAGLSMAWWLTATVTLLFVRRATAGMLSADLRFAAAIPPRRIVPTALAVLLTAILAGIPALGGPRFWLPSLVSGSGPERIRLSAA